MAPVKKPSATPSKTTRVTKGKKKSDEFIEIKKESNTESSDSNSDSEDVSKDSSSSAPKKESISTTVVVTPAASSSEVAVSQAWDLRVFRYIQILKDYICKKKDNKDNEEKREEKPKDNLANQNKKLFKASEKVKLNRVPGKQQIRIPKISSEDVWKELSKNILEITTPRRKQ